MTVTTAVVAAIKYVRWDYIALCIAMSIVFGLEMLGVFGKTYVTITYIFRSYIPKYVLALIWLWLAYHFRIYLLFTANGWRFHLP